MKRKADIRGHKTCPSQRVHICTTKNTTNTDISKSGTFLLVVDVSAKTLCAESRLFVPSSNDRHYYDIFH